MIGIGLFLFFFFRKVPEVKWIHLPYSRIWWLNKKNNQKNKIC